MSDQCGVSFDGDCDGYSDFYVEALPVARKAHRCYECRGEIAPGTRYVRASGKSEGHIWSIRLCQACHQIQNEFRTGTWVFGELWREFEEVWRHGEPLQPCLNRVSTVVAKTKLRDKWLEFKGVT